MHKKQPAAHLLCISEEGSHNRMHDYVRINCCQQVRSPTDRRSTPDRVDPALESTSESSGRFQNLVQVRVLKDRGVPPDSQQRRAAELEKGRLLHAQQPFREPSIYAWLPPPGSSARAS